MATIVTYPQYWACTADGRYSQRTDLARLPYRSLESTKQANIPRLVDRLGIRNLMAPIRSAFDALGPVLPDIAAEIGLADRDPGLLRHPRFQRLAAAASGCAHGALYGCIDRHMGRQFRRRRRSHPSRREARCARQCGCLWPGRAVLPLHGRPRVRNSFRRNRQCSASGAACRSSARSLQET